MESTPDAKDLEALIKNLNEQSTQCYQIIRQLQNDHKHDTKLRNLPVQEYKQEYIRRFDKHLQLILSQLRDVFGDSHYVTQLLYPKRGGVRVKQDGFEGEVNYEARNMIDYIHEITDIIRQLEKKLLVLQRKETIEREFQADIVHQFEYNEHTRVVTLNHIKWVTLTADSPNHRFFEYVYKHPNQELKISDLRSQVDLKEKKMSNILSDLGLTGNIKTIFLGAASDKSYIKLLNPVRKQDIIDFGLPELSRDDIIASRPKNNRKKSSKS